MICDLETGVCGVAGEEEIEIIDFSQPKKSIESLLCDGSYLFSLLGN